LEAIENKSLWQLDL